MRTRIRVGSLNQTSLRETRLPKGKIGSTAQPREFRLFLAQQILSENLNVPLRILRHDALSRARRLLPQAAWAELDEAIGQPMPSDPLKEGIPRSLMDTLSPPRPRDRAKLALALWSTPRSAPHPLYDELKKSAPQLKTVVRLNLLRKLRLLGENSSDSCQEESLELPAGLLGYLNPIVGRGKSHPGVLVTGPCRLVPPRKLGAPTKSRYFDLEVKTAQLVSELLTHEDGGSTSEDETNLLVLSTAYLANGSQEIRLKAAAALRVLALASTLQSEFDERLPTASWARLVQWIFFWQSERALPLIRDLLREGTDLPESQATLHATRWFPCGQEGSELGTRLILTPSSSGVAIRAETLEGSREAAAREEFELSISDSPPLSESSKSRVDYLFRRSVEDRRSNRAWQEYVAFDRLRHELQRLQFDDVRGRECLFTRKARTLVAADLAVYLSFDSLGDCLTVAAVRTAPTVTKNETKSFARWLRQTARDKKRRAQSAIYRCLDTKCFQAQDFAVAPESHPFLSEATSPPPFTPNEQEFWGIDVKDFLALPVQFHDRILGVLYLASSIPGRFRYHDRVRTVSFVRIFEGEIFEARLFTALQAINERLAAGLRDAEPNSNFYDFVMKQLGHLLGTSAALLWWQSPTNVERFELIGKAGDALPKALKHGVRAPEKAFAVAEGSQNVSALPLTETRDANWEPVASLPWKTYTAIPLPDLENRRIVGAVTIHEDNPTAISKLFVDELQFLRDELKRNLFEYMEHRERLAAFRDLIGHEVQSALYHIDSLAKRISRFRWEIYGPNRDQFDTQTEDLRVTIDRAHHLLDFLTMETPQLDEDDFLLTPYKDLRYKLKKPNDVKRLLLGAVHGRAAHLKERGITLETPRDKIPHLWVDRSEVSQVFANLVDNVVKYSSADTVLQLEIRWDSLEYFVSFVSVGAPLRAELAKNPDRILLDSVRGVDAEAAKRIAGSGKGLFLASELARMWGGKLDFEYRHHPEQATYSFTVLFPRYLAAKRNPWTDHGEH